MSNDYVPIRVVVVILTFICACTSATAAAFERQTPVVQAVKNVGPAVVNISSEYEILKRRNPFGSDPFFDNFFRDFFERRPEKRTSLGSGVIIDGKRGFILTNAHVVEKTATIKVLLQDEREFEARIVGADPDSDLAVLQISSTKRLPAVQMGDSDDLLIGETVIAIGNPFGFSHTVTTGVISAVNRSIKTDERIYHRFIQTDASINPGNSGGPLLNINGKLIGINTAIYAKAQGIGFAIPINKAKRIVNDLILYGHVIQGWIGLSVQDLDDRLARYLKITDQNGVLITQVEPGSPAAAAGIEESDLVMAVQGRRVKSSADYYSRVRGVAPEKNCICVFIGKRRRSLSLSKPRPIQKSAAPSWPGGGWVSRSPLWTQPPVNVSVFRHGRVLSSPLFAKNPTWIRSAYCRGMSFAK